MTHYKDSTVRDRVGKLNELIVGLDGDLESLGEKPDKTEIRDALRSVIRAVQELARLEVRAHSNE